MDCVNCGAPLSEKHDLCEYCGTLNDTDLRRVTPDLSARPVVPAAQARGDGELERPVRPDRKKQEHELLAAISENIRRQQARDRGRRVRWALALVVFGLGFCFLGDRIVRREIIARAHVSAGVAALQGGSYSLALQCCRDAVRVDSRFPDPYYVSGMVIFQQYVWEEGKARVAATSQSEALDRMEGFLRKASSMREPYPQVHYYLAICYFKKGSSGRAVIEIDRCLQQLPATGKVGGAVEAGRWRESALALKKAFATYEPSALRLYARCSRQPSGAKFAADQMIVVAE